MHETRFSMTRTQDGGLVLSAQPIPEEVAAAGRIIDLFTPTSKMDGLQPAAPDQDGVIAREVAPEVLPAKIEFVLQAAGYSLE